MKNLSKFFFLSISLSTMFVEGAYTDSTQTYQNQYRGQPNQGQYVQYDQNRGQYDQNQYKGQPNQGQYVQYDQNRGQYDQNQYRGQSYQGQYRGQYDRNWENGGQYQPNYWYNNQYYNRPYDGNYQAQDEFYNGYYNQGPNRYYNENNRGPNDYYNGYYGGYQGNGYYNGYQDQNAGVPTDENVANMIRAALRNDRSLSPEAQNAQVSVKNGIATLTGTVKDNTEKSKVESIAKQTNGVKSVSNNLNLK